MGIHSRDFIFYCTVLLSYIPMSIKVAKKLFGIHAYEKNSAKYKYGVIILKYYFI
jgi:hypothetical protein